METVRIFSGSEYRMPNRTTAYILGSPGEVRRLSLPAGVELRELSPVHNPDILRIWRRNADNSDGGFLEVSRAENERFYTLYQRS